MLQKIIATLVLAATACTVQAAETVKVYNWSEYIAPDTLKNFQARTGIVPVYELYDSNEVLNDKLMARNSGYDVVFPSTHFMARQVQAQALMDLDRSKLPNWDNLNPVLLKMLEVNDPGNRHGFPYMWGSTGIGYNIDKVKAVLGDNAPVGSWDLIFKPENISRLKACGVAFVNSGPELLPITLNYLGLPPHSKNPDDYKKAEALLMKIRPYVAYFDTARYTNDLANGDVCVVVGYNGDVLQAQTTATAANKGVNIGYSVPREGAPLWFDMVAMPADAPNPKAGYAFMNYLLEPKVIAGISNYVHYANGNEKADALIDPALHGNTVVYPDEDTMSRLFALEAMPADIDRIRTQVWTRVMAGEHL
ncbi:polyamine ABC transporter substrate-binding protein [Pseudomonas sp.]|uniref:polyamine ABC transporter substrate-binding protein n=1 Tax=Pseudomonas sp. TaxID=306 RepID=UPI003CC6722C